MAMTRRQTLGLGMGAAAAGLFGLPAAATAVVTAESLEAWIAGFASGRTPEPGPLALEIEPHAENGAVVPVTLSMPSPMTPEDHVEALALLAPANPQIGVFTARLTPRSGAARLTARIRLAESQTVTALARLSDGRVIRQDRAVTVSIGGCGA